MILRLLPTLHDVRLVRFGYPDSQPKALGGKDMAEILGRLSCICLLLTLNYRFEAILEETSNVQQLFVLAEHHFGLF